MTALTLVRTIARGLSEHERNLAMRQLVRANMQASWSGNAPDYAIHVDAALAERAQRLLWSMRVSILRPHHVPGTRVLLLSRPAKMPCPGWSLPAVQACPFMVTGPNAICNPGVCYARKGRYQDEQHQAAMQARYAWTRECLGTPAGTVKWIDTMIEAIGDAGYRYFRAHDSADLFSPAYTRAWTEVCRHLPEIRFWFPTRSWQNRHGEPNPWLDVIVQLAALDNVAVRPSALHFDDPPPVVPGLAAGTSVTRGEGYTCPAPRQNHHCGDCRVCWDRPDLTRVYQETGFPHSSPDLEELPMLRNGHANGSTSNGHTTLPSVLPVAPEWKRPALTPVPAPTIGGWLEQSRALLGDLEQEIAACEARIRIEQERIAQLREVAGPLRVAVDGVPTVKASHERIGPPEPPEAPPSATAQWSRLYESCVSCGQTDQPHASRGRCTRCYNRARSAQHRATVLP